MYKYRASCSEINKTSIHTLQTITRYKLTKGVKITSTLNGQWNETQNYESLDWLKDHGFRELLKSYFNAMIVNLGYQAN